MLLCLLFDFCCLRFPQNYTDPLQYGTTKQTSHLMQKGHTLAASMLWAPLSPVEELISFPRAACCPNC